jgi:hypothetical protein
MSRASISAVLFLFFISALAPRLCWSENEFANVKFPVLGEFRVEAQSSLHEPGSYPYLVFKKGNISVKQFDFVLGKEYSKEVLKEFSFPARVKVVTLKGIKTPLVLGVVGVPGGSDSSFETMIIGEVGGALRDLLPKHPATHIEDAVCLGVFGKKSEPLLLVAKFIWAADEAHPVPHRYSIMKYSWNGHVFSEISKETTKLKHRTGLDALKELGYSCKEDVTETLAPDVR